MNALRFIIIQIKKHWIISLIIVIIFGAVSVHVHNVHYEDTESTEPPYTNPSDNSADSTAHEHAEHEVDVIDDNINNGSADNVEGYNSITVKSGHINIDLDSSVPTSKIENEWDGIYDNNTNAYKVDVIFKMDGNVVGNGYSNDSDISISYD